MSKLKQTKIPMVLTEENILKAAIEQGAIDDVYNWKLVRERDKFTCQSKAIKWLEWDESGRYKADHQEAGIGRSLIMSPFNEFYTWQTTEVTEIVEQKQDYIKFKTKNSVYELFKIPTETA